MIVLLSGLAGFLLVAGGWQRGTPRLFRSGPGKLARLFLLILFLGVSFIGWRSSSFIQVWVPPWSWREFSHQAMIPACILAAAALLPASWLKTRLRFPALLAVVFWAAAHLASNGDLASMLLFGTPGAWALWHYCSRILRGAGRRTPKQFSLHWDAAAILAGLFAWVALFLAHGELFGTGLWLWFAE